jgi:hypothetical protein
MSIGPAGYNAPRKCSTVGAVNSAGFGPAPVAGSRAARSTNVRGVSKGTPGLHVSVSVLADLPNTPI